MRGMSESYEMGNFGMGAGASVRKGKTAKQVRRARKALDAKAKTGSAKGATKPVTKPATKPAVKGGKPVMSYGQASKNYSVGKTPAKARQVTPGKPKNYRRSQ